MDASARFSIAEVFVRKRVRVVLDVIEEMKCVMFGVVEQTKASFRRVNKHGDAAVCRNVGVPHFRPARHWDIKIVRKAFEVRRVDFQALMPEHTKSFFIQRVFRHTMKMVHCRLGTPADVEAAVDICLRPTEDADELIPVTDFIKGDRFDRRPGNDKSVEFLLLDVRPVVVKRREMFDLRILGHVVRDLDKRQIDLQWCGTEQAGNLDFRIDLVRHEIQQTNAQRTVMLIYLALFVHHHDAFRLECGHGGQTFGNSDRHGLPASVISQTYATCQNDLIRLSQLTASIT